MIKEPPVLIEVYVAACMFLDNSHKMTCFKKNSVWYDKEDVSSFYPDPGSHYKGPTCWLQIKDGPRQLMAESCVDFNKRFNSSVEW